MTLELNNPDLATDPTARRAVKDETVAVEFAVHADGLVSAVGLNRYLPGDALITGSTGDRWCVSRDRFDAKYDPLPGTVRGEAGFLPESPCYRARQAHGDAIQRCASCWRRRPAR